MPNSSAITRAAALPALEAAQLLANLCPDQQGHDGVDTDERDGVVDESELDVLTRRQPSLQVPAHAQLDEAIEALGHGRENVRAEAREIDDIRDPHTPRMAAAESAPRAQSPAAAKTTPEPASNCRFAILSQGAWSSSSTRVVAEDLHARKGAPYPR